MPGDGVTRVLDGWIIWSFSSDMAIWPAGAFGLPGGGGADVVLRYFVASALLAAVVCALAAGFDLGGRVALEGL